ncbi:S1C family serine protease [Luteolibacter luteus]|uniref:Serine protease n=1 Tax=Luteolibacter luteus TaxID=2728835 RepID=A0A858RDE6_9BACT|nr:S1C family serine protease [Luteolibacter luteus]QJE95086.1 serine protease [Luteolibacter luteus]
MALSEMQAEAGCLRSSGRELPAEVFVDPVSRLVVFHVSGPAERALPLAPSASKVVGTELHVKGVGAGKATGWVKQLNGKMLPLSLLKVDYSSSVPRAGTPLTDANGAVIAIAHQTTGAHSGYALPVDVVKRVLEDVQGAGRVSRGWIGLKLLPQSTVPEVTNVQEGSPSATAGVKSGDVLLEVGSRRLADYADAVNAFYYLRPGVATPVRVKRGAQELSISVTPVEKK